MRRAFARPWTPGEPRLVADLLSGMGDIAFKPLADEQVHELETLHQQAAAGSIDRLHIAHALARCYWGYRQLPRAIDLLESLLAEHQAAMRRHAPGRRQRGPRHVHRLPGGRAPLRPRREVPPGATQASGGEAAGVLAGREALRPLRRRHPHAAATSRSARARRSIAPSSGRSAPNWIRPDESHLNNLVGRPVERLQRRPRSEARRRAGRTTSRSSSSNCRTSSGAGQQQLSAGSPSRRR